MFIIFGKGSDFKSIVWYQFSNLLCDSVSVCAENINAG